MIRNETNFNAQFAVETRPPGRVVGSLDSPAAASPVPERHQQLLVSRRLPASDYAELVRAIRAVVKATLPPGAIVAVISKGDYQLLDFKGRVGCHFPQDANGRYAGYHPADSAGAIAELEKVRRKEVDYLLIPSSAFWWLDFYEEFARQLETTCRKICDNQHCLIYQLSSRPRSRLGDTSSWVKSMFSRGSAGTGVRTEAEDLRFAIDSRVPDQLTVGEGTAFYIGGWCYHPRGKIRTLNIVANEVAHPLKAWGIPRPDVKAAHGTYLEGGKRSYRSGFWGFVPFGKVERSVVARVALRATLGDGRVCEREVARVRLEPGVKHRAYEVEPREASARVAICLAAYNPPLNLFRRQIESIRSQTFTDWFCLVSDDGSRPDTFEKARLIIGNDSRFRMHRVQTGNGFYRNFERCLSLVPKTSEFVALSDHDDYWHPDKLQTLVDAFEPTTSLAYSDMRIVDESGRQLAPTYWTTRPNNYNRFSSLLMANTITGGASMFRRSLLPLILPFPERIGEAYHDHWIGVTALATGSIKYVPRPLYDYVQHGTNVIGHYAPARPMPFFAAGSRLTRPRETLRENLALWQRVYFGDLLRLQLITELLQLRCGHLISQPKAAAARRIQTLGQSWSGLVFLAARILAGRGRITETVGAERPLLGAALWRHAAGSAWPRRLGSSRSTARGDIAQTPAAQPHASVEMLREKIAPLCLKPSARAPRRLNLLIPTIDLDYFFGGYITKFNLARRLAEEGLNVRMVVVDHCEWRPGHWREQLKKFRGLEQFFDRVEVAYLYDRSACLEVSPADLFMATTWWTAHIAHQAARALGAGCFLYLIQEYEALTFPMGSLAALANQSYEFPHFALFSSELLRSYFRDRQLGVFADRATGETRSVAFQNAITPVGEISRSDISNRMCKRLLFYARPEPHAARNMFELGILALGEAIQEGCFQGDWEFYGIGTVGSAQRLPLAKGSYLTMLPRENQQTYRDILRAHDLGLALMYTPHPSLVPIEMASAGMVVVTTTFANKTQEVLGEVSANLIAVHPTIEKIKQGLHLAAARLNDFDARVAGSRVKWATDWEGAFNENVMAPIRQFVEAGRGSGTISAPNPCGAARLKGLAE